MAVVCFKFSILMRWEGSSVWVVQRYEGQAEKLSVLSVGKYLETDIVSCGVLEALDHTDLPHVWLRPLHRNAVDQARGLCCDWVDWGLGVAR